MYKKIIPVIAMLFIISLTNVGSKTFGYQEQEQEPDHNVKWFTDARFGMFVHFGLYSIPAGVWEGKVSGRNMYAEWIQKQGNWPYGIADDEYQALAAEFNPTGFDAEEWVLEAKNAGMKYMLITAKHHDGFALWPSKVSDFNIMDASPFRRDLLGELAEACKKHNIKLGFYYSHWQDWYHPGGARPPLNEFKSVPPPIQVTDQQFEQYWQEKCLPQVAELIENYNPAFLWFDTWGKPEIITDRRLDELIAHVRRLDPDCLINSRILQRHPDINDKVDFISMGDNSFPTEAIDKPWETSGTMNHSWGFHQLAFDWEPAGGLLRKLMGNVSRNGNFQMNIGPMADGKFPPASVRRLREMGAWLHVNGDAVYSSMPNPLFEENWGFITWKEENGTARVYLSVTDWPENRRLVARGIDILPEKIYVLETGQVLDFLLDHSRVVIQLPVNPPDENITVIVMEMPAENVRK